MTSCFALRQTARSLCMVGVLLAGGACAAGGRDGRSSSYLIVDSFQAADGARPTVFRDALDSDVQTVVNGVPAFLEDAGRLTLRLAMKNPAAVSPSAINFVTLRGYRVTFSRADGRNIPGVDVPYPFDGALTATVRDTATTVSFVLVRAQAKLEAPLRALAGGGGALVISTLADIVLYGADQAGRDVTVSARISVSFSDWGDS